MKGCRQPPRRDHHEAGSLDAATDCTASGGRSYSTSPGGQKSPKVREQQQLPRDLHLVSKKHTTFESGFQYLARTAQDNGVQQPCPALPCRDRPTACAASRRFCQLPFTLDPRVCSLLWCAGVRCSSSSGSRSWVRMSAERNHHLRHL